MPDPLHAPRFFVPGPLPRHGLPREVALPDGAAQHVRVRRLREGEPLVLFDGEGGEFHAVLAGLDRHAARATLRRHDPVERECAQPVTLVQAVIAADPMEMVVRKAVELGVGAIVPVVAARSQGGAVPAKRVAHWRAIAVAACEQCGRNRVPDIAEPQPFTAWLDDAGGPGCVMLAPEGEATMSRAIRSARPEALLVGPEGGWTDAEIARARSCGARLAHLGARVLRAETAAIAALAIAGAADDDGAP